uniref:Synaptobrevin homolog YKT6 n=1 Tax=Tetraselmis sp. GSL018 TaxID=582737 RepID=A0A061S190_9CHLO
MKVTALYLMKSNGTEQDPFILGQALDLTAFGYFQRKPVKEMLNFASRTVSMRTLPGQRKSVQEQEYFLHVCNRNDLVGLAVVDSEYPSRAAFCIINKCIDDFISKVGDSWKGSQADGTEGNSILELAIVKYQDPANADKLLQIQKDLDETKVTLHKTIESVLERGEKLDQLYSKSNDLSEATKLFYNQARKTNSCCKMM